MNPSLTPPPFDVGSIILWLFSSILSFVVAFYIGVNLRKKLKGRYFAPISLAYWIVALVVYFVALGVLHSLDPYSDFLYLFIHPLILVGNLALDIAFLLGYFIRR